MYSCYMAASAMVAITMMAIVEATEPPDVVGVPGTGCPGTAVGATAPGGSGVAGGTGVAGVPPDCVGVVAGGVGGAGVDVAVKL